MLEFTFTDKDGSRVAIEIRLIKGMTGGQALDEAAAQYKTANPWWAPGHPDVTITIRGR